MIASLSGRLFFLFDPRVMATFFFPLVLWKSHEILIEMSLCVWWVFRVLLVIFQSGVLETDLEQRRPFLSLMFCLKISPA